MAEVFKTFAIALDTKVASYVKVPVIEGDTGNRFVITLTDDGTAVDLSTSRVTAVFSGAMGTAMQDSWTSTDGLLVISGASHNIVTFDLLSGSYANGLNKCELQVYSGTSYTTLITSASFNFDAKRPILNDTTIASTTEYPILVSLIDQVESLTDREQADWTEADNTKGTYIQHKPVVNVDFAAAAHASRHLIGGADALNAMPYDAAPTNILINGGFDVWQRGTSFSSGYTADRWCIGFNGSGATRTITRQAFTVGQTDVPSNPTYYLRYAQSVAGSDGTYNFIVQRLEDVSRLSGKTVTLSFYAKADSARNIITQVEQNFGSGGSSAVYVGDVIHALTTSWQLFTKTLTLPSVSGKTIGANNFLSVYIMFPVNTTFTIDIANVQLNYGSVALPFVPRSFDDELRSCQRYYEKSYNQSVAPGAVSALGQQSRIISTGYFTSDTSIVFSTVKRVAPTVTIYSPQNGSAGYAEEIEISSIFVANRAVSSASIGERSASFQSNDGTFTIGNVLRLQWVADAEL